MNDMMDIMRQQPNKNKGPTEEAISEDIDQGVVDFSFAQNTGYAHFCYGDSSCWLHRCPKKGKLSREKWLDPEYFDKYQKSKEKKDKAEEEQSHTMIGKSHVQVAWTEDEIVLDDDDDDVNVKFSL